MNNTQYQTFKISELPEAKLSPNDLLLVSDKQNGDKQIFSRSVTINGVTSYLSSNMKTHLSNVIGSEYLVDKRKGGEVSASIAILSGNYTQTTDKLSVHNFSSSNGFIHAVATKYGDAAIGSKAYCILSVCSTENAFIVSGDFQYDDVATKNYTDSVEFGKLLNTGFTMKQTVKNPDNAANAVLSDLLWSYALSASGTSQFGCLTGITKLDDGNTKLYFDDFKLVNKNLSNLTFDDCIDQFVKREEDNALYVRGLPLIGTAIPAQFNCQHAEGGSSKAICKYTHAEGRDTIADNRYAHAEGSQTIAGGVASHAEGQANMANGSNSHAEGRGCKAYGIESHTEGLYTTANGAQSHAAGYYSKANADQSWCWNGNSSNKKYTADKVGSFCVNPNNGLSGFYIGNDNFISCVLNVIQNNSGMVKTMLGIS